jgi:hypothetical protein
MDKIIRNRARRAGKHKSIPNNKIKKSEQPSGEHDPAPLDVMIIAMRQVLAASTS